MKQNYISILITSKDLDKRVDVIIAQKLKDLSRNRLQQLITNGNLKFNDTIITQPSIKLKKLGELILEIPKPKKYSLIPQNLELDIVYEDEHLIVLNKKAGTVVHPGSGNNENTLVNGLLSHCKNLSGIGGVLRPGVVHRIDKMTSGLLVFAKDDITHNSLSEQFKRKSIKREYDLFTWNFLKNERGTIETNIERSKLNRQKMAVAQPNSGKIAITQFWLINSFDVSEKIKISYVKCKLFTGRTHQIRLHMSYIGNPLLGDRKYSRNNYHLQLTDNLGFFITENFIKTERHALHASKLGFYHPLQRKNLEFDSKFPEDLSKLANKLSNYSKIPKIINKN